MNTPFNIKLKLRGQILAGFALVILVAGVIAAQGVWGLRDLERSFDTYAELGDDAALVSRLRGDILETMLTVRTWLRTEDTETKQQVLDLEKTVEDEIAEAQKVITDPERAAKIDQIDAAMQRFHAGFDLVVELVDARNGFVRDEMNQLGPKVRKRWDGRPLRRHRCARMGALKNAIQGGGIHGEGYHDRAGLGEE
ncbi:hypothetical protein CKO28_27085, partial [Rhodovibrio sodomensis]